MILFLSKAYNIVSLVRRAKAVLVDKIVDPFLRLVEDCKLQAVKTGPDHPRHLYGSEEDDRLALKSLSEINITEEQTKEFFASEVVKSLERLLDAELSTIREELLSEFLPDDVCPLGAQFCMDAPQKLYQVDSRDSKSMKEDAPIFSLDDDSFPGSFDSQKNNLDFSADSPNLLSVNQFIESVLETAHQVGRLSISNAPDVPYKEMAGHCEALLIGKQQKMLNLMSSQQKQEYLMNQSLQNHNDDAKWITSGFHADFGSYRSGNPFVDDTATSYNPPPTAGRASVMCVNEYQHHPHSFRLPASSPYDNFLKAAGC